MRTRTFFRIPSPISSLLSPVFLLLTLTAARAGNGPQFLSATTGAACYEVTYHQGYLYAGCGNTLMVFDARGTAAPLPKLFEYRFTSNIDHIVVRGERLFIAANHAGLSMWDIAAPSAPRLLDEYIPDSLNEAAYHISFLGDTIFVAYKGKMALFRADGDELRLLGTFARQTGATKIRGCAVRDSLLAFTTAYGAAGEQGVHIYNARTLEPLAFHRQSYCSPEGVVFGEKTPLLHVLGGTASLTNPFDPKGLFYSLDITNPRAPVEVFSDTLDVVLVGFGIAQPMNAEIRNDTLFVSTQSAIDVDYRPGDPFTGNVYVYDATSAARMKLVTTLNAGLWFFDVALAGNTMFVASEWYGVKMVDITNLFAEVDRGNTLTGGWNLGSAIHGNRMVVANEGYGFKLFDITDPRHPALIGTDTSGGFCMSVEFSEDGRYIYGYYWTGEGFRVYDAATLERLGGIGVYVGDKRTAVWRNKALNLKIPTLGSRELFVVDVENPAAPRLDTSFVINDARDMALDRSGKLFITTNDSLFVLDLGNRLRRLFTVRAGALQDFNAVALYRDTLYTYVTGIGGGLVRYRFADDGSMVEIGRGQLPIANPRFLAADSFGLYAAYAEQGLYAFDRSTLEQTGYYRHGMEFIHPFLWGVQDIFCVDGLIALVEYFGQTTLLSGDPRLVAGAPPYPAPHPAPGNAVAIEYDRAGDRLRVEPGTWSDRGCDLIITDLGGAEVLRAHLTSSEPAIATGPLPSGVYIARVGSGRFAVTKKFVVAR